MAQLTIRALISSTHWSRGVWLALCSLFMVFNKTIQGGHVSTIVLESSLDPVPMLVVLANLEDAAKLEGVAIEGMLNVLFFTSSW